jgi:hypothetical protein
MKVLKVGRFPEDKVYVVTCGYCKSEIEFAQKEGKITSDQRDGDYISITCPICKKQIIKSL